MVSEEDTWRILRDVYLNLNGQSWHRSDGWLSQSVPICEWYGVTCLPRNSSKQWKPVIELELSNNNCDGKIPISLGDLTSLHHLDLSSNTIEGTLPRALGNLTQMMKLDLSDNAFVGTIPDMLSEMFGTLEHLDLGGNTLSGPIPTSFFYLTRLSFLNLSSNAFYLPLPDDIAALSSLRNLYLSHNQFYGSLPSGLASLSELVEMDVSHNSFSGEILPDWAASLTSLQVFIASRNNFSGSTAALGYMANIRKLFLDHNALSGEIHPYLYQLSQSIAIDLSYNFLTGWVTESLLSTLLSRTQLIYLSLVGNPGLVSYEGRIPPFLGADASISTHNRIGSFSCHRLFLRSSRSTTLMVDPEFFSYAHCSCVRDSYGVPPNECYDCPPGAYCCGSNFFTFDAGWYPIIKPVTPRHNNLSSIPPSSLPSPSIQSNLPLLKSEIDESSNQAHTKDEANKHHQYLDQDDFEQEHITHPRFLLSLSRPKPSHRLSSPSRSLPHLTYGHFEDTPSLHELPTPADRFGGRGMEKPLDWLSGPVLLYPCPDLSTSDSNSYSNNININVIGNNSLNGTAGNNYYASACNPTGESIFYYNSSKKYGILNNATLCSKGYDLRLCSLCTCAAASNASCYLSEDGSHHSGSSSVDCSCYYRSSMKCVRCESVWRFPKFLALVVSLWGLFVLLLAFIFYSKKAPVEATLLRFEWISRIHRRIINSSRGNSDHNLLSSMSSSSASSSDYSQEASSESGMRHSGYLKIMIVYLQTLSMITKDPILVYFKLTLGEIFTFGAICAWPLLSDPFMQHLFYLLLPVALLLGIVLALLIAAIASKIAMKFVRDEMVQEEDYVNDHLIYGGGGLDHNANGSPRSKGGVKQGGMSGGGGSFKRGHHSRDFMDSSVDLSGQRGSGGVNSKVEEYSLVSQGLSAALLVHWWFLFGIAYRSLSVFNCASDPLSSFLETQPWLGCNSPEYHGLRTLAILGSVIYLGIIPILFAVLLFVFRRKVHDPSTMSILEILCASYRSGVFWYELVATLRRISLAAVVALVPGSSAFKMSSVCLVLVVALYLQIVFRPFVTKFENVMEELAMVTVLVTYAAQFGVIMRFKQMDTLNTITVVFNFLMIAAIAYTYLSRTFFPYIRFCPWSKKETSSASPLRNDFEASSSTLNGRETINDSNDPMDVSPSHSRSSSISSTSRASRTR